MAQKKFKPLLINCCNSRVERVLAYATEAHQQSRQALT